MRSCLVGDQDADALQLFEFDDGRGPSSRRDTACTGVEEHCDPEHQEIGARRWMRWTPVNGLSPHVDADVVDQHRNA